VPLEEGTLADPLGPDPFSRTADLHVCGSIDGTLLAASGELLIRLRPPRPPPTCWSRSAPWPSRHAGDGPGNEKSKNESDGDHATPTEELAHGDLAAWWVDRDRLRGVWGVAGIIGVLAVTVAGAIGLPMVSGFGL
jgi:hypothetical protein